MRQYLLRIALILFLLGIGLPLAACSAAGDEAQVRPEKSAFRLFDGTMYQDKPDLTQHGLHPITIIYGHRFWPDSGRKDELPARGLVGDLAREAAVTGGPVVIDIEHWYLHRNIGEIEQNLQKYVTLMQWFHSAAPGIRAGYFGMVPTADYARASGSRGEINFLRWRSENARLHSFAAVVDVLFPAAYTKSMDREYWRKSAIAMITEARRFSKTVYVFLWPRYESKELRYQHLPADFWELQLETAREYADGAVIWGGWDPVANRRAVWDEREGWWRVTKAFLARLESVSRSPDSGRDNNSAINNR